MAEGLPKNHLSAELLAILKKSETDDLSAEELELVAAVQDALVASCVIEFAYLPDSHDENEGSEDENDPIAWFTTEDVQVDAYRGTVVVIGDIHELLGETIILVTAEPLGAAHKKRR